MTSSRSVSYTSISLTLSVSPRCILRESQYKSLQRNSRLSLQSSIIIRESQTLPERNVHTCFKLRWGTSIQLLSQVMRGATNHDILFSSLVASVYDHIGCYCSPSKESNARRSMLGGILTSSTLMSYTDNHVRLPPNSAALSLSESETVVTCTRLSSNLNPRQIAPYPSHYSVL